MFNRLLHSRWLWGGGALALLLLFAIITQSSPSRTPTSSPSQPDERVSQLFASATPSALPEGRVPAISSNPPSATSLFFDFTWKLLLLVAMVFFLWKVVMRFVPRTLLTPGSKGEIKVIDRTALGPSSHILLVEVQGARLLVGATAQQITLLADMTVLNAEGAPAEGAPAAKFSDTLVPPA